MKARSRGQFNPSKCCRLSSILFVAAIFVAFVLMPWHDGPETSSMSSSDLFKAVTAIAVETPDTGEVVPIAVEATKQSAQSDQGTNDAKLYAQKNIKRPALIKAPSYLENQLGGLDFSGPDASAINREAATVGPATNLDAKSDDPSGIADFGKTLEYQSTLAKLSTEQGGNALRLSGEDTPVSTSKISKEPIAVGEGTDDQGAECMKFIVYDKPVKTGSTALTKALKKYFLIRNETYYPCNFATCTHVAKEICSKKMPRMNLVEHFVGEKGVINCLGSLGYYKITSVREPLQRWESAFLYNQKKGAKHYGIHHTVAYKDFMASFPACSMHHYYDGLGPRCDESDLSPEERTADIVEQYDEIIDLYNDDLKGPMHSRLGDYLAEENKSPRPNNDFREPFDKARLNNEMGLYNALKQKQKELVENPKQLC